MASHSQVIEVLLVLLAHVPGYVLD